MDVCSPEKHFFYGYVKLIVPSFKGLRQYLTIGYARKNLKRLTHLIAGSAQTFNGVWRLKKRVLRSVDQILLYNLENVNAYLSNLLKVTFLDTFGISSLWGLYF